MKKTILRTIVFVLGASFAIGAAIEYGLRSERVEAEEDASAAVDLVDSDSTGTEEP